MNIMLTENSPNNVEQEKNLDASHAEIQTPSATKVIRYKKHKSQTKQTLLNLFESVLVVIERLRIL